ncbi:ARM repeat-containing protein [Xylariaceae sp. FL0255]|nr:ARM repeat-containing protein [Xylariaceae sp. FL0255]
MASAHPSGSLNMHRTPAAKMEENIKVGKEEISIANDSDVAHGQKRGTTALSTTSLVNQSCPKVSDSLVLSDRRVASLSSLPQKTKLSHESPDASEIPGLTASDGLLSRLYHPAHSGNAAAFQPDDINSIPENTASSNSVPMTPATGGFGNSVPAARPASAAAPDSKGPSSEEVALLKLQLAQAHNKISRLDQELAEVRPNLPATGLATSSSPVDAEFQSVNQSLPLPPRLPSIHPLSNNGSQQGGRDSGNAWPGYDDSRSDTSDPMSSSGFNRPRNIWGGPKSQNSFVSNSLPPSEGSQSGLWTGRPASHGYAESNMGYDAPPAASYRPDRLTPDFDLTTRPMGARRGNRYETRFNGQGFGGVAPSFNGQTGYGGYNYPQGQYEPVPGPVGGSQGGMGVGMYSTYQPTPVGTPLSPLASEFTSMSGNGGPWKQEPGATEGQTYLPTTEPLNYRRLLDRNVNCNWKYIVDKIVCSNDQQASIFLQQKLKVGTPDQKYEIVEAIVAQAYPLMVNRFGNFLVQRCFEHGTPEQVIKIAEAIRGCTLNLSMDPFGCHVVQKAFDSVPEDYKAIMVHELLRRIPETVIHRYACHVWQKLFELRWTESPPQIMKYVNDALRGMWHEVALGETGSLVVQNIFENCLEEDKRPCIEEVLGNIDIVAHGQFGNWCIQHICEHGAPADRSRAIDHVIRYAAEYSMDQYASKVVEKCLKIGGGEFLSRYLDRVCEGRIDRPRIPLIDIASDQYGNYLIQWILTNANPQHRDVVAAHIRKHMVSLRGSKFGSRVGMLCTNPAITTRPGPGVGPGINRMPAGPRFGGRPYQ